MDPENKVPRTRRPAARRTAAKSASGAGDPSAAGAESGAGGKSGVLKASDGQVKSGTKAPKGGKSAARSRKRSKDGVPPLGKSQAAQEAGLAGTKSRPGSRAARRGRRAANREPVREQAPTALVPHRTGEPQVGQPDGARNAGGAQIVTQEASRGPGAEPSNVQAHLYEIQQNLDRLLRDVHRAGGDAESRRRAAEALNKIATQLGADGESRAATGSSTALRRALSTDQLVRRLSRMAMKNRADEVDEFGLDRTYEAHVRPALTALYLKYFRAHAEGLEHIPSHGRALLVCNRGGALPVDGLMLKVAVDAASEGSREFRWLIEDFNFHAPFLGPFLNRLGAVRACQENAERLLQQDSLVGVFPEGIKGVSKLYSKRYQLQRFGRGGYIKLALRTQTPIVPAAIVGPEDAYPILYRLTSLAKALGVPLLPLTPTFPWLGPAGLIPLPSRFVVMVGPPLAGLADYGPEAADDAMVVNELNERVRNAIQGLLSKAQASRGDRVYS